MYLPPLVSGVLVALSAGTAFAAYLPGSLKTILGGLDNLPPVEGNSGLLMPNQRWPGDHMAVFCLVALPDRVGTAANCDS